MPWAEQLTHIIVRLSSVLLGAVPLHERGQDLERLPARRGGASMTRAWWPLGCAAAFSVHERRDRDARMFVVRHAPVGSAVEVAFGAAVGKGTADQAGDATIVLTGSPADTQEVAAAIYTDICDTTTVRLVLAARTAILRRRALGASAGSCPAFSSSVMERQWSSTSSPACRSSAFGRDACPTPGS